MTARPWEADVIYCKFHCPHCGQWCDARTEGKGICTVSTCPHCAGAVSLIVECLKDGEQPRGGMWHRSGAGTVYPKDEMARQGTGKGHGYRRPKTT